MLIFKDLSGRMAVLGLLSALMLPACAAADIRPDGFKRAPTQAEELQGRQLLRAAAVAHGEDAYREKSALIATIDDDWSMAPLPVKFLKPLPGDNLRYRVRIRPGSKDVALTFLDGENKGQVWGLQDGRAFEEEDGKREILSDATTMESSVGVIGFLLHAPFMLESAKTVYVLPSAVVDGRRFDRVFLSWGDGDVNENDQFIAYIDAETRRLSFMEFTARGANKALVATLRLSDHTAIEGVIVPGAMVLTDGIGGPPRIHAMKVLEVKAESAETDATASVTAEGESAAFPTSPTKAAARPSAVPQAQEPDVLSADRTRDLVAPASQPSAS